MRLYQVVFINGRIVEFFADSHEFEDGIYTFYFEGDVVAEFKRDNIAGYVATVPGDEDEEYD